MTVGAYVRSIHYIWRQCREFPDNVDIIQKPILQNVAKNIDITQPMIVIVIEIVDVTE